MAAPTAPIMGFAGFLYYNSGTYGSPTWVLIDNVGDIKATDEMEEAELKLRSQGGFVVNAMGLRKLSYEWEMVYDPADTKQTALRTAYAARTATEFLVLDQANATTGSAGIRGSYLVSKFPRQEPVSGAMMQECGIKPAYSSHAQAAYTSA